MSEEPIPYGASSLFQTEPIDRLLARLIYGEARGERVEGRIAVACVVRNRVERPSWWGRSWREVMTKPYQFTALMPDGPNYRATIQANEDEPIFRECVWIAQGVILGIILDNTDGATHYHSVRIRPSWASRMKVTRVIGNHVFLKDK